MGYSNKFRLILFSTLFFSCINKIDIININGDALGTTYNIILDSSLDKSDLSNSIDSCLLYTSPSPRD